MSAAIDIEGVCHYIYRIHGMMLVVPKFWMLEEVVDSHCADILCMGDWVG